MNETSYLLSTSANSEWLLESISQADRGELQIVVFPISTISESNEK
jgi:PHD/YefM family antitoxin component YafN of YafNO toxin-antitoxin module